MRTRVWLLLVLVGPCVGAQTTEDCVKLQDDSKRLKCFDAALNFKRDESPAKVQPAAKPTVTLTVREKGDLNNFAGFDGVDKPAQFNLQRSDGQNASVVKLGLIATFRPVNDLGWQPYVSAAWARDTAGKAPKDIRDLTIGITGALWDPYESGWTLFPTLRATRRHDLYAEQDANRLNLQVNVVALSWVNAPTSATENTYSLVPHFGVVAENRSGGSDGGQRTSGYAGFDAVAQLNRVLPRFTVATSYQRFVDHAAPSESSKRAAGHATLSLAYALSDPDDKAITLRPYLTLTREVGTNLLGGGSHANKTWLGLGLKYN